MAGASSSRRTDPSIRSWTSVTGSSRGSARAGTSTSSPRTRCGASGSRGRQDTMGERIAPNLFALVQQTMREHPEIDPLDDVARGRILDYVAVAANGGSTKG